MATGIKGAFQTARFLGDTSSLSKGYDSVAARVGRRVGGRGLGKMSAGMTIANLFIWAEFLQFMRQAIEGMNAKPVYVVTMMRYAWGYNKGFKTIPTSPKRPGPPGFGFWDKGVEAAVRGDESSSSGGRAGSGVGINRSGIYQGGRYMADIRSVYKGDVAGRFARRTAGAETSRFFWGTLANPDRNVMEVFAKRAVKNIRRNIRDIGLVDTGALAMSVQWGNSIEEAREKSRNAAISKLNSAGITSSERIHAKVVM